MRISNWSSVVCSSDLLPYARAAAAKMIVPPSDSPPRNSSNLLRSERRWPSPRSRVMILGLEFGDIAQPAQGPDRFRRPVQPLAEPRDVEFDRVRARFVVEAEKLLGEIVLRSEAHTSEPQSLM